MKGNRKESKASVLLMVISMVLLVTFVCYWLRKEYLEIQTSVQNQTKLILNQTVRTLEDSLWSKAVRTELARQAVSTRIPKYPSPVKPDRKTKTGRVTSMIIMKADSISVSSGLPRIVGRGHLSPDSISGIFINRISDTSRIIRLNFKYSNQSVSLSSDSLLSKLSYNLGVRMPDKKFRDSLVRQMRTKPAVQKTVSRDSKTPRPNLSRETFVFKLDSANTRLSLDTLKQVLSKELASVGISLGFKMVAGDSIPGTENSRESRIRINSEGGKVSPVYSLLYDPHETFVLNRILPQVVFAFLLIAITSVAFFVVFRGLQKQKQLNQFKNEFISNVTHELKTPLATVSVALEALESFGAGAKPELVRDYLQVSRSEVNRLSGLVDEVLTVGLNEANGYQLRRERVDMTDLIQKQALNWKPRFDALDATLKLSIEAGDFIVRADREHLSRVLNNLIDNAVKYSYNNIPEVTISLSGHGNFVRLSVQDRGVGIPPEFRKKVFEKFFRIPANDRHNVKGHGLGLNYVWSIVKLNGGRVEISGGATEGTVVQIELPVTQKGEE